MVHSSKEGRSRPYTRQSPANHQDTRKVKEKKVYIISSDFSFPALSLVIGSTFFVSPILSNSET